VRAPFIPPQRELISVPVTDNAAMQNAFDASESTSYETELSEVS
jgi:hypothetical protein